MYARITSYNVCYTKLLRDAVAQKIIRRFPVYRQRPLLRDGRRGDLPDSLPPTVPGEESAAHILHEPVHLADLLPDGIFV